MIRKWMGIIILACPLIPRKDLHPGDFDLSGPKHMLNILLSIVPHLFIGQMKSNRMKLIQSWGFTMPDAGKGCKCELREICIRPGL